MTEKRKTGRGNGAKEMGKVKKKGKWIKAMDKKRQEKKEERNRSKENKWVRGKRMGKGVKEKQ